MNHYWRKWHNRMVISREGRAYRKDVQALLAPGRCGASGNGPRKPPSGGRIALAMDAFPPDRRRRDPDNIQNPNVRLIGLTATPYRMTTGTICSAPPDGLLNNVCYEVGVRELIVQG